MNTGRVMNSKPGTQRRRLFLVLTLVILHGSSGVSLAQPVADCAPRKPSLFAWWTGDGTALDLVGANHAILQNAVSFKSDAAITAQDTTYEGQDIIIEAATVTMDGIHSFRSLLLTNNGTLTHSPGSTPGLDLFVTGDVLIEANSSITGNGLGDGPDSGPAAGESKGGLIDRYGSGAGDGGLGGSTPHGRAGGPIYGSIASPVDFGSGGGSGGVGGGFDVSGGTGGGAVRLNVGGNLVLNGSLTANGTGGGSSGFSGNCGGGGSGGSIWLTARTLMGSGIVSADGGNGGGSKGGGGAGGRIALHATNFLYGGVISVNPGAGFQAGELGTYYAPPVVLPDPESFESGWGGWWQDGFIWNLRPPGNGPINAYTGTNALCGNTGGNYAPGSHGRLISPRFIVPSLSGDDRVVLRFWQSYQYGTGDAGLVQVSTQYETNWTTLFIAATNVPTSGWTLATADLTSYQGQELRLGFLHTADGDGSVGPGWFIDDVSLSHSTPMRLALNTPSAQRFTANPQGQYFVVSVPAGGHLRVTLDPAAAFGINEVYVRRGALPSPGAYDFRYQVNGGADQSIFAPNAGACERRQLPARLHQPSRRGLHSVRHRGAV